MVDAMRCHPHLTFPRHRCAFSLIELVVVVAILGVIAAVAVPRFSDAASGQRAEMAALRLTSDLAMVRELARAQSRSITVTFDPANVSYAIKGDSATVVSLAREPYGLTWLQASFGEGGASELTADGYGRWTAAGTAKVYAGSRMVSISVANETVVASAAGPSDGVHVELDLGVVEVDATLGGGDLGLNLGLGGGD